MTKKNIIPTYTRALSRLILICLLAVVPLQLKAADPPPPVYIMDMPGAISLIKSYTQLSLYNCENSVGQLKSLLSDDYHAYWHSKAVYAGTEANANSNNMWHGINIDLRENVKGKKIAIRYQLLGDIPDPENPAKPELKENVNPKEFTIYTSATGEEGSYELYGVFDLNYQDIISAFSIGIIELAPVKDTKYIRIVATKCRSMWNGNIRFGLTQLGVYDVTFSGAAAALIYRTSQFSHNPIYPQGTPDNQWNVPVGDLNTLLDNNKFTFYGSPSVADDYIQVDLMGAVYNKQKLRLMVMRNIEEVWKDGKKTGELKDPGMHPTKIKVEGSLNNNDWVDIATLDIPYTQQDTHAGYYQCSGAFEVNGTYKYLRFTCLENFRVNSGHHAQRFRYAGFRLYLTDREDLIYEFTPNFRILPNDLKDFTYEHTRGILDDQNHYTPYLYDYCDWSKWQDGKWVDTDDKELLETSKISMPDYSYISGTDTIEGRPVAITGNRQRTSVIYHEIHALKGQHLNLRSFSDIQNEEWGYRENFIRWYDYKTDKKSTRIKFPVNKDEAKMISIGEAGHFAGHEFGLGTAGTLATYIAPENGLGDDEDWIAADFAQNFSMLDNRNVDWNNTTVYEPRIAFRHVFRIVSGEKFAEKYMADAVNNRKYAKARRRYVSARAGQDFQIRFDDSPAANNTSRSAQTYRKADGTCDNVRASVLNVYDPVTRQKLTELSGEKGMFVFKGKYEGKNPDDANDIPLFYRGMECKADKAKAGRYLVRLEGLDSDGNPIMLPSQADSEYKGESMPLIIQEYMIEFVGASSASFELEKNVPTKHTVEHIVSSISEKDEPATPIAEVNFDNYRKLLGAKNSNNFLSSVIFKEHDGKLHNVQGDDNDYDSEAFRFKWPMNFKNTNYSYMYASAYDFNMYTITNSFQLTPFHSGANLRNSWTDRRAAEGKSRGYMYYVNAAADPGEMVQLSIEDLCPGTTLHVSGWVCEQSGGDNSYTSETANLIISMQVVSPDGSERTVHSFVTGYQNKDHRGEWYHFYYSVVLNYSELGINMNEGDTFRIILENNALSSHGADYAVDDIRVYAALPKIEVEQKIPLCNNASATAVQITVNKNQILATILDNKDDEAEEVDADSTVDDKGEQYKIFYTFLKQDVYNDALTKGYEYGDAFDKALLRYKNDDDNNTKPEEEYGWVTFYSGKNEEAKNQTPGSNNNIAYEYTDDSGDTWLVFNTDPHGNDEMPMRPGDDFIVAIHASKDDPVKDEGRTLANAFDLISTCARYEVVRMKSAAIIHIDGEVVEPDEKAVCENQTPMVTIDIQGKNGEDGPKTQPFDWYDGPLVDKTINGVTVTGYSSVKKSDGAGGTMELPVVLENFRNAYRNATSLDGLTPDEKHGFTQAMINWLKELSTVPDPKTRRPRLYINKISYVFPETKVPAGADETYLYVTAIPINRYTEGYDNIICTEPTEVQVTVKNHAPDMWHGFHPEITGEALSYPEEIVDVPLRIGLDQINGVSYADTDSPDKTDALQLPLRWVHKVSQSATSMDTVPGNPYIYLIETDDYEKMENLPATQIIVGKIVDMRAFADTEGKAVTDNYIKVIFDNDFKPKEGCYYRFKFKYQEDKTDFVETEDGDLIPNPKLCGGDHVFTIKVVPMYQKWTGGASRNWSNDENWRRVTYADLNIDKDGKSVADKKVVADMNQYVSNGTANTVTRSYAPLDFSKVIIDATDNGASIDVPYLFEPTSTGTITYDNISYKVTGTPEYQSGDNTGEGTATENIQYDMAATEVANIGISCRPWYTHNVDEVHFAANATITGQQHLDYNKAWADFELTPNNWFLCSSPLQQTVAGDLYLPTATGRQETQLFKEITFTSDYDRFRPAVFQRSWNHAGDAKIYKYNKADAGEYEDAYEKDVDLTTIEWSNVYNDVKEDYGKGNAFAIKADLAKLSCDEAPEKAMFRLPKADEDYKYYQYGEDEDGNPANTTGDTNGDIGPRNSNYRLNPTDSIITVKGRGDSKYFMIGNPFMCYMDVKKFIDINNEKYPGLLTDKCYFVDSNGSHHLFWQEDGSIETQSTPFDVPVMKAGYVPPFTSFFVETLETKTADEVAAGLTFVYNEAMMLDQKDVELAIATLPQTIEPEENTMHIESWRGDIQHSDAVLRYSDTASADYVATEDVALLNCDDFDGDRVKIFTLAGSMSTAINTVPGNSTVALGIITKDNESSVVRFTGNIPEGTCLYDTWSDTRTPLYEGTEMTVDGSTVGRYFITSNIAEEVIDTMNIYVVGDRVFVSAPGDDVLQVNVYDLNGILVDNYTTGEPQIDFTIANGFYVIDAVRGDKRISKKVKL